MAEGYVTPGAEHGRDLFPTSCSSMHISKLEYDLNQEHLSNSLRTPVMDHLATGSQPASHQFTPQPNSDNGPTGQQANKLPHSDLVFKTMTCRSTRHRRESSSIHLLYILNLHHSLPIWHSLHHCLQQRQLLPHLLLPVTSHPHPFRCSRPHLFNVHPKGRHLHMCSPIQAVTLLHL